MPISSQIMRGKSALDREDGLREMAATWEAAAELLEGQEQLEAKLAQVLELLEGREDGN